LGYQEGQILIGKLKTKFRKIFRKKEPAAPVAEKEMVIQKKEGDVSEHPPSGERPPAGGYPPVRKPSSKRPPSKKPYQGKPSGKHKPQPAEKKSPWDVAQFNVPETEGKVRFHDLGLPSSIMHGVYDLKFSYCTPVQAEVLPRALEGVDVTGRAQTGTGKSAAFLIAIYTLFLRKPIKEKRRPGCPRALILAPTWELALQITKDAQDIGMYTRSRILTIFGGMV
jgi:ATP-dependent RNA helicase RhlB